MIPSGDGQFPPTRWTLIARITSGDEVLSTKALDELCAQYHYPLYCFLRRHGCEHDDAQDVLQEFLVRLIRQRALDRAEEAKGRLRGYLSRALINFLIDWREKEQRRERFVGASTLSVESALDFNAIADRYERERFTDADSPERVFERQWAHELLRQVVEQLAVRYAERNRSAVFAALRPVIEAGGSLRGFDTPTLAAAASLNEDALRQALTRLLREFGEVMRDTVRQTVEDEAAVSEELTYLIGLFR